MQQHRACEVALNHEFESRRTFQVCIILRLLLLLHRARRRVETTLLRHQNYAKERISNCGGNQNVSGENNVLCVSQRQQTLCFR